MSDKVTDSLNYQKQQLEDLLRRHSEMADAIQQLRGAVAALEYVQGLGLVEPVVESTDSPSQAAS